MRLRIAVACIDQIKFPKKGLPVCHEYDSNSSMNHGQTQKSCAKELYVTARPGYQRQCSFASTKTLKNHLLGHDKGYQAVQRHRNK